MQCKYLVHFMLSVICISLAIFFIFPHANMQYKCSLWNGTPLLPASYCLREILVIDTLRCEICPHMCCIKCAVVINNAMYPAFLACYIMRTADAHDLICDLMRAKLVTSLIVPYGYCVHNIHIRQILLPMSMAYETMDMNSSSVAAFCSDLQNERLIFPGEAL